MPIFQVILCFIFATTVANADWNSGVTIEDISTRISVNVNSDGIQLTVNLTENAMSQFKERHQDLSILNDSNKLDISDFAKQVIIIKSAQPLVPEIKTKRVNSLIDIFFPFSGNQPQQLEITPDFDLIKKFGEKYSITVSHQGLPVIDHGVLTAADTLILDWQDPWYSHFLNPKLKRGHSHPVMAFLYIEPQQIKTEIIVRVKEMSGWTDLSLRDETMIYPDEFASVKQKIGHYLFEKNKIDADSMTLTSTLNKIDYIRMGASDIQAYEPQQAQQQVATLIGVSIVQPIQSIPQKIQWQWNLFNKNIQRVAIRAYDPAGLFDSYVTPDYRIFEWENMLADIDLTEPTDKPRPISANNKNTLEQTHFYGLLGAIGLILLLLVASRFVSLRFRKFSLIPAILLAVLAGYYLLTQGKELFGISPSYLDEKNAKPVVKQLLWNVYQAFESTQEDIAYENLAYSLADNLQEKIYLQNRQALLSQDGAHSKVNAIEIKSLTHLSSSFDKQNLFDCEWLVVGEVIHWGHQHRRENLYRAQIKIASLGGNWKITELESIGQQRVD